MIEFIHQMLFLIIGFFPVALSVANLLLCLVDGPCGLPQLCRWKERMWSQNLAVRSQRRRSTLCILYISGTTWSERSSSAQTCAEKLLVIYKKTFDLVRVIQDHSLFGGWAEISVADMVRVLSVSTSRYEHQKKDSLSWLTTKVYSCNCMQAALE